MKVRAFRTENQELKTGFQKPLFRSSGASTGSRCRRLALVPCRRLLVGVSDLQHSCFSPVRPNDLQANRQTAFGEATRNEIAGNPHTLIGRVFLSNSNSRGRRRSGFCLSSAIVGAGIGVVGVARTSTSAKTEVISRRSRSSSRRHSSKASWLTLFPVRIRRRVSG